MDSTKSCRQCRRRRPATQNICPCPVIRILPNKSDSEGILICISTAKPLRSLVPAFDRLMSSHAVQNSMPLPLNLVFGRPATSYEYGQQEASASSGEDDLSKRQSRRSDFCSAARTNLNPPGPLGLVQSESLAQLRCHSVDHRLDRLHRPPPLPLDRWPSRLQLLPQMPPAPACRA